MKQYYKEIDVFKGIAIILIILLHSQCEFPINLRNAQELHIVRSTIIFLSPNALFFFASGFLFYRSIKEDLVSFMKKKTIRLLIPMMAFSLVAFFLKRIGGSLVHSPSSDSFLSWLGDVFLGNYYWFLYSLFFIFLINKLAWKFQWIIAIVFSLLSMGFVLHNDMTTFEKTIYYNLFFFLGASLGSWGQYGNICSLIRNNAKYSWLYVIITILGGIVIVDYYFVLDSVAGIYIQHFLFPLIASSGLWVLSILNSEIKSLSFFGKYSLQYYLNHLLIILGGFYGAALVYKFVSNYWLALGFVLLFTIIVSSVMLYVERRFAKFKIIFGL